MWSERVVPLRRRALTGFRRVPDWHPASRTTASDRSVFGSRSCCLTSNLRQGRFFA